MVLKNHTLQQIIKAFKNDLIDYEDFHMPITDVLEKIINYKIYNFFLNIII